MLENSTADVLLILDCCEPVGGGSSVRSGTRKKVLAATGFNRTTPGVGEHSFSGNLCDQLLKMSAESFDTAQLCHDLVNRLRTRAQGRFEHPVLDVMGEGGKPHDSIRLLSYRKHPINLIARVIK